MRAQINNRDYEQISAYLDGQLAPGEKRKLEERLRAHPELQEVLDDLTRTRALIRMAPRRRAPRNFTLTPAMVGDTGPSRKQNRTGFFNLFPVLSFASAVATILLVATLVFDIGPTRQSLATDTAMLPQMEMENAAPTSATFGEDGQPDMGVMQAPEASDAQEAPAMEAAPAEEHAQEEGFAGPDAAGKAAGERSSGPIINWNAQPGMGGAVGMGGGPESAIGRGGDYMDGRGGAGDMYGGPDGSIVIPPSSINSLTTPQAAAESDPETRALQSGAGGSGPILGIPSTEQAGQIIGQSSQGHPVPGVIEPSTSTNGGAFEAVQPGQQQQTLWDRSVLGLSFLRWTQILLVLIAVATGIAAVLVRRQARL